MNKEETLSQLIKRREELVKRYIGVWSKPQSYYNTLELLDKKINEKSNKKKQ